MKKKITLAYPYTDGDGVTHDPDDTIEVDATEARRLVQDGRARAVQFDPGEHTVDQVLSHLAGTDGAERERILAAELAGKARTTITNSEG